MRYSVLLNVGLLSLLVVSLSLLLLVEGKLPLVKRLKCPSNLLRLPKWIRPRHYDLIIETNIDDYKPNFEGIVQIELEIGEFENAKEQADNDSPIKANQIVLHADEKMEINQVTFREISSPLESANDIQDEGQYVKVMSVCKQREHHTIVITLERDLLPNSRAQLYLSFSRELENELKGYYLTAYKTAEGELKNMAVTQFEVDHARKAFPCFDEPAFKATFSLTLVFPEDRQALSNMDPILEETLKPDQKHGQVRKMIRFEDTPLMSTYLLAFAVGQFDYLEHHLDNGRIRMRVYTPPGRAHQATFVLDIATRSLPMMEDYFDQPFPLKKIDFISVPELDSAVAMENWGLITFLESAMLVDEAHCTKAMRAEAAQTVVHELGHQWFGNLVTMDWWDDLWLNEAFASWVEANMTLNLYPEFEYNYIFVLDQYSSAHSYDRLPSVSSIGFRGLQDSSLVDNLMNPIVYDKGVTVLRYLHDEYIGAKNFRTAIRRYIDEHSYNNTKGEDLWRSMELSSSKEVRDFMESWLFQSGHPLISANSYTETGKQQTVLELSQRRFHLEWSPLTEEQENQIWIVPITILLSDNEKHQEVMEITLENRSGSFKLPDWFELNKGHWLKLNANSTGMYKVLYSNQLFSNLKNPIKKSEMPAIDRLNLLTELRFLYDADQMLDKTYEEALYWFENEQHMGVLEALQRAVDVLPEEKETKFEHDLFSHITQKYAFNTKGLDQTSLMEERAREKILLKLVKTDHKQTIEEALKVFDTLISGEQIVEPFLRSAMYTAVAKHGSDRQKQELLSLAERAKLSEERLRIEKALESSGDPQLFEAIDQLENGESPSYLSSSFRRK